MPHPETKSPALWTGPGRALACHPFSRLMCQRPFPIGSVFRKGRGLPSLPQETVILNSVTTGGPKLWLGPGLSSVLNEGLRGEVNGGHHEKTRSSAGPVAVTSWGKGVGRGRQGLERSSPNTWVGSTSSDKCPPEQPGRRQCRQADGGQRRGPASSQEHLRRSWKRPAGFLPPTRGSGPGASAPRAVTEHVPTVLGHRCLVLCYSSDGGLLQLPSAPARGLPNTPPGQPPPRLGIEPNRSRKETPWELALCFKPLNPAGRLICEGVLFPQPHGWQVRPEETHDCSCQALGTEGWSLLSFVSNKVPWLLRPTPGPVCLVRIKQAAEITGECLGLGFQHLRKSQAPPTPEPLIASSFLLCFVLSSPLQNYWTKFCQDSCFSSCLS